MKNRMNGATTSCSNENESSVPIFPSEDELIVAQILLDLRTMMSLTDSLADSNWKRKRRRSCLDNIPLLLSIQRSQNEIKGITAAAATEKDGDGGGGDRTSTSPDSPFLFAQADESDEKFEHSSKMTSTKRSKKNQLDMIQQLTQQKVFLQGEIENVKNYCEKLEAYNSQLKKIKHEASVGTNVKIALTHRQPFITDPTAPEIQNPIGPITANSENGLNRVGPIGFDLNAPAEETLDFVMDEPQPSDLDRVNADERTRSAEARKIRRGIMKMKSMKRGVLKMS